MKTIWNDAYLDKKRKIGDPETDNLVEGLIETGRLKSVDHLMNTLVRNETPPPDQLPCELIDFLNKSGSVSAEDLQAVRKGQRLFSKNGHIMLLTLVCGSLPTAYAARKGVKVLRGTRRLLIDPNRRLWETAQMVVNIMGPGGLSGAGRGIRTAQKVRLMHAAVRNILLTESDPPWDEQLLGKPVNQEDMAGTLLLFSHFVLDRLEKLGVWIDPEEKAGYFKAWQVIGGILGVLPELIPANLDEAVELNALIWKRQQASSQEGRDMLHALLELLKKDTPLPMKWAPGSTIRYLLPPRAADMIGVPPHRIGRRAIGMLAKLNGLVNRILGPAGIPSLFFRRFGLHVVNWLIKVDRGHARAKFDMPAHLRTYWGAPSAAEKKTFWQRWLDQLSNMRRFFTHMKSRYVVGGH
jgi:ER-bound oxygenase mpaB/B'/Rubber oxygenase, catalytic domain